MVMVNMTLEAYNTSDLQHLMELYMFAMNSFQSTGVIVFALSNDDTKGDADISAGLPELFTELKEAWLNVLMLI